MDNPLSGKVGLDITDYKTAVAEMNRSIRVIESGFRASAAALGDWSNDASGLELRMKALTSQIGIQQQKVSALQAEYQRVAEEKGENSRAAQELEIKLNREVEALGKMQTELSGTEAALEEMAGGEAAAGEGAQELADSQEAAAEETEGFSDKLKGLKDRLVSVAGDLQDLGGRVLNGVKAGLIAVVGAVTGAVVGLGALVLKSAATADELVELSDKTGLSVEQLQELQFIGEQTGTLLETVTGSLAKLIRNMAGAAEGTGAAHDAFETLGVPVTDVNGNLRDSQEVFGEVLDALQAIENPTERDALAMEVFGKSAQELNPLIAAGSEGMAAMAEEAYNLGAVMGEGTVNNLAALNDVIAGLKLGFQGLLGQLAGAFLPIFQAVATAVQNFVSNPDVQAGLQNIITRVTEFSQTLATAIEQLLAGDIQGALSTLFPPDVVEQIITLSSQFRGFVDQLVVFVTEHAEGIKGAFVAIGAVLAGAGIVAALTAIINPITLIIAAVALLGAAWAEDWGGIRTSLTAWWEETGKPIFDQLVAWLEDNIPAAIETLRSFWVDVLQPAIEEVWTWMKENLFPLLTDLVEIYFNNVQTGLEGLGGFWTNTLQPAMETVWDWMQGTLFPLLEDLWAWLEETIPAALETLAGFWEETLQPALDLVWGFISEDLMPLFEDLQELIETGLGLALTVFAGIWENVLWPAINDIYVLVSESLKPALDLLESFWTNTLKPAFEKVDFLETLAGAFDTLKGAIQAVRDIIQAVITKLGEMGTSLPDWATPGSPMPLDYAFQDLGATLDRVARKDLVNLSKGLGGLEAPGGFDTPGVATGPGPGPATQPTVINNWNLTAQYAYQSQRSLMQEVRLRELMAR